MLYRIWDKQKGKWYVESITSLHCKRGVSRCIYETDDESHALNTLDCVRSLNGNVLRFSLAKGRNNNDFAAEAITRKAFADAAKPAEPDYKSALIDIRNHITAFDSRYSMTMPPEKLINPIGQLLHDIYTLLKQAGL